MKTKIRKNWKTYCETSYNSLCANLKNWGKPEYYRPITRIYYINVFDCGLNNPTGYISENALNNKKEGRKTVFDHCLSPQFICRMILDNPDKYLKDYESFEEIFWISCRTIVVTQKENYQLSALTINDGLDYKVYVPTDKKYNYLGIKLFKRPEGVKKWKDSIQCDTNIIDVPESLLEYEKNFLID